MENINKTIQPWFLHIDLDAFFASVEQLDHPEYRGQPVIVGGRKDDKRGVVSTASYEARKFGVHSAMPIFQALRLCPQGIYVRGRMDRYAALSYQIMNIFREFSPDVDQMSIDEAFIDLTGTENLFGPPEETAMKVKARVKELTGLTVSVGLAPTKYLAKIASGYSKPDGFYFVKPGEEENFMLSLPLKKLWGVGPKALERLKKAGIKSTRDIYDKPLDLLNFLFGNNMGTFLYNVVRGEENEVFTKKRKSHSISAENTFSCDITDIYTAETALLELAQGVIFRLLKEEKFSRTVTVKIKYDDFTSVSIQKTLDRNVITLDTFFDTIKTLFEQKYETGRGIRLLGVGFDKVEDSDKPYQQSLFGEKEEKKQAVEKAILNLNKKHPEIKIQKARLLKTIAIFFMLFSFCDTKGSPVNLYAKENTVSVEGAGTLLPTNNTIPSDGALFTWDLEDSSKVQFDISGQWKAEFLGSFNAGFSKNKSFSFSPTIPIFKQDIELSSMFTINDTWYFEGNFADNFDNNTIAFGYKGSDDKYFRSARLSNRNITMPGDYSAEHFGFGLSGGNNQAPGISLHWQDPMDGWSGDALLRFDMTAPKTAVYYGMNKVNNKNIGAENYLYGHSFVFPDKASSYLTNIKNIYIEDINGKYADAKGNTYRKLSASEYVFSKSEKILYLSQSAKGHKQEDKVPAILITFISQNGATEIDKLSGNYDDKSTFKGKIQKEFNKATKQYNLGDFDKEGSSITQIANENALIIQKSQGFSPYLVANTYRCPTSTHQDQAGAEPQLSVVSGSSGEVLKNYIPEIINNNYLNTPEDFFQLNSSYGKIINKDLTNNQFPFANTNPEIYLGIKSKVDPALQISSYSTVSEINIGTKASAGTIQVYRNGQYDPNFIYNKKTGAITLTKSVSSTDTIKINWQEEATDYDMGAVSAALGYKLNILPNLKWDISLTAQKPVSFEKKYSTSDNLRSSFVALSTGIAYEIGDFKIQDKIIGNIQKPNDLGVLLVATNDNSTSTVNTNNKITTTYNFTPSDFSQYKTININFAYIENTKTSEPSSPSDLQPIKIILDNGQSGKYNKNALTLTINDISKYKSPEKKPILNTIKIDLQTNKIYINNNILTPADYTLISLNNIISPSKATFEITNTTDQYNLYIESISYQGSGIIYGGENYLSASYSKDKILSINNFPIFENCFINTNSTQKFTKDKISVLSNLEAGITITGITLQSDFSLTNKEFTNAGHLLKTATPLFNFISFNEEYRWNKIDKLLNKSNSFNLSLSPIKVPISFNISFNAQDNELSRTSNHLSSLSYNFNIDDFSANLNSSLSTSQNINLLKNKDILFNKDDYFENWYNITKTEFSEGSPLASARNTKFINKINFNLFNFVTPSITYDLSSVYENKEEYKTFNNNGLLDFSIPLKFQNFSLGLNLTKSQNDINHIDFTGTYFTDLENLFNLQNKYSYLYTSIPFYELFDTYFINNINGNYSTKYEITFNKKLSNSFKDLYIPSSASFAIIRDIKNSENFSDTYQLKTVITNTSINNFGKNSKKKLCKWFNQEEIISSITGIMKIPTDNLENISLNLTSYLQILLMINQNTTLHSAFDLSFETGYNWSTGGTIVYSRPGKSTLILSLIELFWPKIKETQFIITRKDSLNYKIAQDKMILKQEYTYNHTVDMNFLDYFTVSTGIGGTVAHSEDKGFIIGINYSLGGLVRF